MLALATTVSPLADAEHAIATALSDVDALLGATGVGSSPRSGDLKQAAMQQLLTGQTLPGASPWLQRRVGTTPFLKTLGDLFNFSGELLGLTQPTLRSRQQVGRTNGVEGHCYLHYGDRSTGPRRRALMRSALNQDIPKFNPVEASFQLARLSASKMKGLGSSSLTG